MYTSKLKYPYRLAFYGSLFVLLLTLLSACNFPWTSQASPTPTPPSTIQCTGHSSNPVTLNMYYGSEKEAWINVVVPGFNSRKMTACDGPITVKATPIGSAHSMHGILDAPIPPSLRTPPAPPPPNPLT